MPHQCTSCGRTFADGSKEMLSGCPDCGGNKFQFEPAASDDENAAPGAGGRGGAGGATAAKKQPADASSADSGEPDSAPDRPTADAPNTDASTADAPNTDTATADAPSTNPSTVRDDAVTDDSSAVDRAAATVRDWVRSRDDDPESSERSDAPDTADRPDDRQPRPHDPAERPSASREDSAQASARSDVVSESELPNAPASTDVPTGTDAPASTDNPTSTDAPAATDSSSPPDASASSGTSTETSTATEKPDSADESNVVDAPDDDDPGLEELREELNSQFESIRIVNPGQYELNLMELYEREEYIISLQEDGKYVIEVPDAWDAPER